MAIACSTSASVPPVHGVVMTQIFVFGLLSCVIESKYPVSGVRFEELVRLTCIRMHSHAPLLVALDFGPDHFAPAFRGAQPGSNSCQSVRLSFRGYTMVDVRPTGTIIVSAKGSCSCPRAVDFLSNHNPDRPRSFRLGDTRADGESESSSISRFTLITANLIHPWPL